MTLKLANVGKRFGAVTALSDINLRTKQGEFLALLGPSGSGKTTLLRVIAGLDFPETGAVFYNGEDITRLSIAERRIGFVFQQYALFRHMTVAENVAFGLSVRPRRLRPSKQEIKDKARELLDLVQLGTMGNRLPDQLSGGQRQRVALARALAVDPRLLLLDEPFGALDAKVRKELRQWLRGFHDRVGLTSIFVTHDQEEALEVADRIVVMSDGRIEQIGTPTEVYDEPVNPFVFNFIGEANSVPVERRNGTLYFQSSPLDVSAPRGGAGKLFFRPHDVQLRHAGEPGIPATVTAVRPRQGRVRIEARAEGLAEPLELELSLQNAPDIGRAVSVAPTRSSFFGEGTTL